MAAVSQLLSSEVEAASLASHGDVEIGRKPSFQHQLDIAIVHRSMDGKHVMLRHFSWRRRGQLKQDSVDQPLQVALREFQNVLNPDQKVQLLYGKRTGAEVPKLNLHIESLNLKSLHQLSRGL